MRTGRERERPLEEGAGDTRGEGGVGSIKWNSVTCTDRNLSIRKTKSASAEAGKRLHTPLSSM